MSTDVVTKSNNHELGPCFSTFFLQRNLPQMFALLVEPHAMIKVFILLQPHRTVAGNFIPGKFGLFRWSPCKPGQKVQKC